MERNSTTIFDSTFFLQWIEKNEELKKKIIFFLIGEKFKKKILPVVK